MSGAGLGRGATAEMGGSVSPNRVCWGMGNGGPGALRGPRRDGAGRSSGGGMERGKLGGGGCGKGRRRPRQPAREYKVS